MIRCGIATHRAYDTLHRLGLLRPGDTALDFAQDTILTAHLNGQPLATLLARPMIWVHGLTLDSYATRQRVTEALLNYALGWGPACPRLPAGCLFQVDASNAPMVQVAQNLGGAEDVSTRIFRLDL